MAYSDSQATRLMRGWRHGASPMLAVLVGANVAVFILQAVARAANIVPLEPIFALSREGISSGFAWQFVTYMFLHSTANPLHIVANMVTLYFAGREVQAVVGPRHLLAIYFAGGIAGGLLQMLLDPGAALIGASAGVFAVLIAFITIAPELNLTMLLFFVIPVRMRAKVLGWTLVGFSVLSMMLGWFPHWGHAAHLGGCVIGWFYIKQMGFGNPLRIQRYFIERRQREERVQRMPPEQYISEEIDPVLDKIARDGIHSLTRSERRILEKGREKIARRTSRRF